MPKPTLLNIFLIPLALINHPPTRTQLSRWPMPKDYKPLRIPFHAGTHPLVWTVALVCAVLTAAVVIAGVVVFVGYLAVRPKAPFVSVSAARLQTFRLERSGHLTTKLTVVVKAENDNAKAPATFTDFRYDLNFDGINIASLQATSFEVPRNYSVNLAYEVEATPIPLDSDQVKLASTSVRGNHIIFELSGHAKAGWRIGPLGSARFWCHLNCHLEFEKEGHSIVPHCSSK